MAQDRGSPDHAPAAPAWPAVKPSRTKTGSSMHKDGETFTQTEALLFTLVNGKVAEIQDFFADISLNDRLFS